MAKVTYTFSMNTQVAFNTHPTASLSGPSSQIPDEAIIKTVSVEIYCGVGTGGYNTYLDTCATLKDTSGHVIDIVGSVATDSNNRITAYWSRDISAEEDARIDWNNLNEIELSGTSKLFVRDDSATLKVEYIVPTNCGAPTSVTVNGSSSQVTTGDATATLAWSGASGGEHNSITGYVIRYRESSNDTSWGDWYTYTEQDISSTASSGSIVVNLGAFGTYRQFSIGTFGTAGKNYMSGYKESPVVFRTRTACTPPTSVSVASNNVAANASVKLSWSGAKAGAGVTIKGYDIYRATSATGTYTKVTTVPTTATSGSVNVTAPSDNGSYYYKIVTLSSVAGYDSAQSSTYATLTCKITACGAPTLLSLAATSSTGSSVRLSWSGASAGTNNSISGYEVQRRESTNGSSWGSWGTLGTTLNTYLDVTPPTTAGNYYQYQVRTLGSAGANYNSGWKTSSNTLRRSYTACGAPTSCAVDSTLSLVATTLRWSGATAGYGNPISRYEVQRRSKAHGGSWSAWSTFETTSGTLLTVSPPATSGHYYQYRVRAQGTAGEAYYSGWKESTNTLRKAHKTIPAFTDPTLIVGQTDVKAIHITELQNVLNDILLPFMGVNKVAFTELEKDSDAKHWGAHVQEIKNAIDSTGFYHEVWIALKDEVTADVIEQIRRVVRLM